MPVQKNEPKMPTAAKQDRKPWKKKSPIEIVLEQGEKLKAEIAEMEKELSAKKRQLQKFEEVRKVFES